MKYDIEKICALCVKFERRNQEEQLKLHKVMERPFQKTGVDLFEYRSCDYVLVVNYYSKFVEIRKLTRKTAKSVQKMLLAIFAVLGIPEEIIADNMRFNSREFKLFAKEHKTRIT